MIIKDYDKLVGYKSGRLLCIGWEWRKWRVHEKKPYLKCVCDCGVEKFICAHYWNITLSCGCIRKSFKGRGSPAFKHGEHKTQLYKTWSSMKERLVNPRNIRFVNYGGKGIKRCKDWEDFNKFKEWAISAGYNDGLTIERIDVFGDYCPENCTWIPMCQQKRNTTKTVRVEHDGVVKPLIEWCEILKLPYKKIAERSLYHFKKTGKRQLILLNEEANINNNPI